MPVDTQHDTYAKAVSRASYTRIAAEGGEKVIDSLPKVSTGNTIDDDERHAKLKERAYYTNFTGRTESAMTGAVFRKEFKKRELPDQIDYLLENADGEGMSLKQLAKRSISELLVAGNYGYLADYPEGPQNPSLEQVQQLGLRANIKTYNAETIINFDTRVVNGVEVLSLVVLLESDKDYTDIYSWKIKKQYRVLALTEEGVYTQAIYDESLALVGDVKMPKQNGSVMNRIPFYFIGTTDNKAGYDKPALYDMACINYAHLRNTAENEEAMWMTNQPMYHVNMGDTNPDAWKEQNPNGIQAGSRRAVITQNGSMDLVQANPVSNYENAIKQKEEQAVAIGAKLITGVAANQTAEAARINASSETSVLNTIVGNVSEAMEGAIEDCARFMGADSESVEIELNDSFYDQTLTAQDISAMILLKDGGLYTQEMALDKLRATGWVETDKTNEDLLIEIGDDAGGME